MKLPHAQLSGLRVATLLGWTLAVCLHGQETPAAPAAPAAAPVDARVLEQVRELSPGVTYEVAQVAKLAKAGVGDSVIQAYVNNSRIVTPPRADELIYLSNHKVSPEVINALIKRGSELQTQTDQARVAAATAAAAATYPTTAPAPAPAEPVYAQPTAPVYAQTVTPAYTYATYPEPSYVYTYSTPYYYYAGPSFGWSWSWYGGGCYAPYRGWYGYNRCAYPAPHGRYGGGYYGRPAGGGYYGHPGGGRGSVSVGVGFAGGGGRSGGGHGVVAVGGSFGGGGGRGGVAVGGSFGGGGRGGVAVGGGFSAGGRHR